MSLPSNWVCLHQSPCPFLWETIYFCKSLESISFCSYSILIKSLTTKLFISCNCFTIFFSHYSLSSTISGCSCSATSVYWPIFSTLISEYSTTTTGGPINFAYCFRGTMFWAYVRLWIWFYWRQHSLLWWQDMHPIFIASPQQCSFQCNDLFSHYWIRISVRSSNGNKF